MVEREATMRGEIDTIIFDLGGTLYKPLDQLVNIARKHLIEAGIHECEMITNEEMERALDWQRNDFLIKYMLEHDVDPYWEPTRELWIQYDRILLENLCIDGDLDTLAEAYQSKWDEYIPTAKPELVDGCKEGLEYLHAQGYKLGIASNRFGDPRSYLVADGILELFGAIEYTSVPGYAKPSPYMLLAVAKDLGSNPLRCTYVGNLVSDDVIAAQRASMLPVLITWCDPEQRALAPDGTIIIEHIDELEEKLKQAT
ncbi:MAG: HAD family hydrolase [Candidatus Thorarchaeota archaeon]